MVESVGVYVHCAMFLSLKKNLKNINIWNAFFDFSLLNTSSEIYANKTR